MSFTVYSADGEFKLKKMSINFRPNNFSVRLERLVNSVFDFLLDEFGLKPIPSDLSIQKLPKHLFGSYVDANQRHLALTLASTKRDGSKTLYGERNIFDSLLDNALSQPDFLPFQYMFFSALAKNKHYRSSIYKEYESKARKLLGQSSLNKYHQDFLQRALNYLYLASD